MSDDKELAERVVALIGPILSGDVLNIYLRDHMPEKFVRDPRVAMAMMERIADETLCICKLGDGTYRVWTYDFDTQSDSLPRAIIEACCLALETK